MPGKDLQGTRFAGWPKPHHYRSWAELDEAVLRIKSEATEDNSASRYNEICTNAEYLFLVNAQKAFFGKPHLIEEYVNIGLTRLNRNVLLGSFVAGGRVQSYLRQALDIQIKAEVLADNSLRKIPKEVLDRIKELDKRLETPPSSVERVRLNKELDRLRITLGPIEVSSEDEELALDVKDKPFDPAVEMGRLETKIERESEVYALGWFSSLSDGETKPGQGFNPLILRALALAAKLDPVIGERSTQSSGVKPAGRRGKRNFTGNYQTPMEILELALATWKH